MYRIAFFACFFAGLHASAMAHPGHGNPNAEQSVLHYLTTPVHLAGLLAVATAVVACTLLVRRVVNTRRMSKQLRTEPARRKRNDMSC